MTTISEHLGLDWSPEEHDEGVEAPRPTPTAPVATSAALLRAERDMWRARAMENRANVRAANLEVQMWKREARKWEARAKANRAEQRDKREDQR